MGFTDGSNSDWYCGDCKTPPDGADQWVQHSISMNGPMVGKTIDYFFLGNFQGGPDGAFDVKIADITITHVDGTITQIPTPLGSFTYGGDMSMVTNQSFAGERVGTTTDGHFYLGDHLGTAQMEFSGGYWPVWKGQFAPFGQELDTQSTLNNYKFTGKERDQESGLDYFGARYYGFSMGRFMSPDPSGLYFADPNNPQSLNLYSYALNNPLKNTDPTGLYCYYGDTGGGAQEDADKQDASQFDFHSSQSECETADENGNKGQWINDSETHQTGSGDWVDNDNRPQEYTLGHIIPLHRLMERQLAIPLR